ncbi:GTPase HflX [Zhenhengia yiwuensis]|uniref:GTPase HflX n=1 Tax=Zhenhengia yiwuensis TaxID=2763666 RepID=UPI002A7632B3|nr:GTPase HflX [Zhenhengia yiwuensis]MDY3369291.1 GTPase HflX [Zhenhengia yiwuensis]
MNKRGIIVGLNKDNQVDYTESMIELENLCEACDIQVVAHMVQNAKKINAKYYIGSGKLEELAYLRAVQEIDIVVFNNELSASQIKNIEDEIGCRVIDRTVLILDIFGERAKTREAKLQVEVASLEYALPRLIGANENLGRQGGGVGTKNKGAGEKKLELDRRQVEEKIAALNKELEKLKGQRTTQRNKRRKSHLPTVALVGYTNAGKSTIMNRLVSQFNKGEEKLVFEKNMLFATLETSVRSIKLPDHRAFLLSDTVGFVSNLPHHLVKAFRSTLEEVCEADLLIHVVDLSSPHYKKQIEVTNETLKQIGAEHVPMIYVYNKVDLIDELEMDSIEQEGIKISAKQNRGMEALIETICEEIFAEYIKTQLFIPYKDLNLISKINEDCMVKGQAYKEEGVVLDIECMTTYADKYRDYTRV